MLVLTSEQLWLVLNLGCRPDTNPEAPPEAAQSMPYAAYVDEAEGYDMSEHVLREHAYNELLACDLRPIISGQEMSEDHLGGDDLVDVACQTVRAVKDGYEVHTWYGDSAEALVVGYRPNQLRLLDGVEAEPVTPEEQSYGSREEAAG